MKRTFKPFKPAARGDLEKALSDTKQLQIVAPESPRPSEMLEGVEITAEARGQLTVDDLALHELLVSSAYDADQSMNADSHTIPVPSVLHFLGPDARRDSLKSSLIRLASTTVSYGSKARRYENVPLLVSWLEVTDTSDVIRFSLPTPIRELMRDQQRYAHIELAPLASMKSKFSVKLYRILALAASREKWAPKTDNLVIVSATPDELADWLQFPRLRGSVQYGKLKERVLDFIESDLSGVRRFATKVVPIHKAARGRPVERIEFHLTLRAPSHHMTHLRFNMRDHKLRVGGSDAVEYRVQSSLWLKAQKEFSQVLYVTHHELFQLWQVALKEALDGVALTDGYYSRAYRGERLLQAIKIHGTEYAAWGVITEEAGSRDLVDISYEDNKAAEQARLDRVGFKKKSDETVVAEVPVEANAKDLAVVKSDTVEGAKEVIFYLDPAVQDFEMEGEVAATINGYNFTGSTPVLITLLYWERKDHMGRWELDRYKASDQDLERIEVILSQYIERKEIVK